MSQDVQGHSPLPWRVMMDDGDAPTSKPTSRVLSDIHDERYPTGSYPIVVHDGGGNDRQIADAQFIVRACNNHDALVAALGDISRLCLQAICEDGSSSIIAIQDRANEALKAVSK